jgi:hypothetical protein
MYGLDLNHGKFTSQKLGFLKIKDNFVFLFFDPENTDFGF